MRFKRKGFEVGQIDIVFVWFPVYLKDKNIYAWLEKVKRKYLYESCNFGKQFEYHSLES